MVNRILQILKEENLTASQFADLIDVQRSSMSHILSGRNNPSLDFVHKILKAFPKVNTDWLMFGTGTMYQPKKEESGILPFDEIPQQQPSTTTPAKDPMDLFADYNIQPINNEVDSKMSEIITGKKIENLVRSENPAEYTINGIKSDNSDKIQANIPPLESNILSSPLIQPKRINPEKDVLSAFENNKEIDRIVIFYKDKTFAMFKPE
jgi:transcriptional regulator with XRE-family HTH domain